MADVESVRLSRKTSERAGEPSKKPEPSARSLEASLEAIQKTGWTPELEAELLDTPVLLQIQPQLMNNLAKEAGQRRDVNLWRLLAEICERRNEDQSAVSYASEALQIQPDDVASMGLLARLCEKRQAEEEAGDWHRRLLDIDPTQIVSNRSLAHLHYQRGEYETALIYLARLVELEPKAHINKLYWLLAKVKSGGVLGLAQPLTDVRRWRSFTSEEEPLAHELFVLVGTQCLQSKQRTRAKQYLTRAMQLAPTPEVEALLAEVSEQGPTTTSSINTTLPTPTIQISSPLIRPSLEPLSAVLLHDTRDRWSRIYEMAISGAGMMTALVVVALFTVWSVPDAPEQRAFQEIQEEKVRSVEDITNISPAKQEVIIFAPQLSPPQQQFANVSPPLPPITSSAKVAPIQPEAKKTALSSDLAKKPLTEPTPSHLPMPEQQIAPQPLQPVLPNTITDVALLGRAPAPKPSIPDPQPTARKKTPQPTIPSPANKQSPSVSIEEKEVRPQVEGAVPNIQKKATRSLPSSRPLAEPSMIAVVPPSSTTGRKGKNAPTTPKPLTASAPSVSAHATPAVEGKLPEETVATVRMREALPSAAANTESVVGAGVEKIESASMIPEPPVASEPPVPTSVTPIVEEKQTEGTAVAAGAQEVPPPSTAPAESVQIEEPLPTSEAGEQKTIAAVAVEEQVPAPSSDMQTPPTADGSLGREEQTTTVDDRTPTREASITPSAITRLSSQLPHTTRFPTRERLVSIPPEQLLSTMKALIKQEIGVNTVTTPARGVFRARVSGKQLSGARPPKMYGQYIVEVMPGPTEGTSRVRAKALLFDWRTGEPMGNAGSLADRLLEKVGE